MYQMTKLPQLNLGRVLLEKDNFGISCTILYLKNKDKRCP